MNTRQQSVKLLCRRMLLLAVAGIVFISSSVYFASKYMFQNSHEVGTVEQQKSNNNSLCLCFSGPFSHEQNILESKIGNPWMELTYLKFRGSRNLSMFYEFKGIKDANRKIKVLVSAVTKDGKSYLLENAEKHDPRLAKPTWVGSREVRFRNDCGDSLHLPITPSEITKLDVRFTNIDGI
jgi:hypothetical protein